MSLFRIIEVERLFHTGISYVKSNYKNIVILDISHTRFILDQVLSAKTFLYDRIEYHLRSWNEVFDN